MEVVKFGQHKEVRARKEHRCGWCGESIRKGERYMYTQMLYEGEFTTGHHLECDKACNDYFNGLIKRGIHPEDGDEFDFEPFSGVRGTPRIKPADGEVSTHADNL